MGKTLKKKLILVQDTLFDWKAGWLHGILLREHHTLNSTYARCSRVCTGSSVLPQRPLWSKICLAGNNINPCKKGMKQTCCKPVPLSIALIELPWAIQNLIKQRIIIMHIFAQLTCSCRLVTLLRRCKYIESQDVEYASGTTGCRMGETSSVPPMDLSFRWAQVELEAGATLLA